MVKSLKTLIRLEKSTIDELRRELTQMEHDKEVLERASQMLLEKLEAEIKLAEDLTEMRGFFGDFSDHIKKQRQVLAQQVSLIERKMQAVREKISVSYSELKKFEIALENHHKAEKEKRERIEQQNFDEIAGQRHRRAREEHP